MATPRRPVRVLTLAVSMPTLAQYFIEAYGREFRGKLLRDQQASADAGEPVGLLTLFRNPPEGTQPCVPLAPTGWRVYLGGALVNIVPKNRLDLEVPTHPEGQTRAIVTFVDQKEARNAAVLDGTYKRKYSWLIQGSDGQWFMRMRWQGPDWTHSPTKGYRPRMVPKVNRRWAVCPPEWPRKANGRPASNQTAARVLGLMNMQKLLKYTGAGEPGL